MAQNIASIISGLQSDKVKVRQDALALMDDALVNISFVEKLSATSGNGSKKWLAVFQALFVAVAFEKANCVKKGLHQATSVSISRFEKAGNVVRNVTERNVAHLPYKVVQPLLEHLIKTMIDKARNCILAPVSLNYIKSIVVICSHSPHLDHLEPELWISLVSLAFAVILEDSLVQPRGFGENTFNQEGNQANVDVDDSPAEVASDDASLIGSKRRRPTSPTPNPQRRSRSKTPAESTRTMSQEQIEFMGLLVVLLRSPHAPYLQPGIAQNILNRIHRFFIMFPTWSNAHTNAVISINIVFSQVELNMTKIGSEFALKMWTPLLSYWNGKEKKDKVIREELVVTMTTFLHLVHVKIAADSPIVPERVDDLYQCLKDDIDRSIFEGLPLDSLRLHLHNANDEKGIFDTTTFRSGYKFDSPQALSWAILELHADSAGMLHGYSEAIDGRPIPKRRRRDSPITEILVNLKYATPSKRRSDNLQVLLFIIERLWKDFHSMLQRDICATLLGLLACDDLVLQSWTFLCLAAVTAAHGTVNDDEIDWDAMWSQAVHRTNVQGVGRAASHAAHVLLASQRLPIHRVLTEIEAFASNLVIQGPTFPFDSVCAFICDCLRIASQDMRLYRVQLPDKVLAWLSQSWNMVGVDLRHQIPSHSVVDILALLEVACGLSKTSQISLRYLLPDSVITDTITERHRTATQRTYLLHTDLQPFRAPDSSPSQLPIDKDLGLSTSLAVPNSREAKVSTLLENSLNLLCDEWKNAEDTSTDATPQKARRSFDAVVIALCFEASLVRNGTQCSRRVIQLACKLVTSVIPCLALTTWKSNERAFILMGLEPLVSDGEPLREDDPWDLILGPGNGSGIRRATLVRLSTDIDVNRSSSFRRELQGVIWKSADVQDTFDYVIAALRNTLQVITAPSQAPIHAGEEEDDDFNHIQVANSVSSTSRAYDRANELCIQVCISFLVIAPILQSGGHNATHDKQLVTLLLKCEASAFLALAPEFFQAVRNKHLYVTVRTAEMLMDRLEEVFTRSYNSSRSIGATLLAIQFLHSTSHLWMQAAAANSKLTKGVRLLHDWLSGMVSEGNLASWKIRDRLVCYLDHYLTIDPHETFWSLPVEDQEPEDEEETTLPDEDHLPSRILPRMADDEDARVRFRVAVANGRLLRTAEATSVDPNALYERVWKRLSVNLDKREHMLTRFIQLGNAMVISSAARRGPYWHLLETCLHELDFTNAVKAVLSAVAERLGFPNLQSLFEAYASQLVGSLLRSGKDFFNFPPCLLGYENRRHCGHATFSLLAPMVYVVTMTDSTEVAQSRERRFADHCHTAQKSITDGLTECFADVAGITVLNRLDGGEDPSGELQSIHYDIQKLSRERNDTTDTVLRRHLDRIVFSIVRTISDTDYSRDGAIAQALKMQSHSDRATATFAALNIYRKLGDFTMHFPNTPTFSALTICRSLNWLDEHVGGVFALPIVYHVMHHLLAAIGGSPLVNEQMRLLHALIIWVSINGSSFKDLTLLRTLLRGAVILLSQSDLAHVAQGIIGWAFGHYVKLNFLEPTFPDLIGRMARIAHDYSRNAYDPVFCTLGNELLDWIEKKASSLSEEASIRPQIVSALPLWPRQPSGSLVNFTAEFNQSQPLSDILQNQHGTSGKFRLVRRLRDLTDTDYHSREQFCSEDFWYLKNCIPRREEIQDEDIDAFADLLVRHAAQIHPLGSELVTTDSVSALHVKEVRTMPPGSKTTVSPVRSIIVSLLDLLSMEMSVQIHRAYKTLRLLLALPIPELQGTDMWPKQYQDEISYLRKCPLSPVTASSRSLEEFEQLSEDLRTSDFQHWICQVATFLNNVLAGTNTFHAQLSPSIHSDPSFATQMLPVLVHDILVSNQVDARSCLSTYFSSVLKEEKISPQRCQSIVETVLHLRNFDPTSQASKDPLAYDKWLDIDFRLLSRGAMSCGAYTTALLFLELAANYSQFSGDAEAVKEDILYDIYSHIEEPDGFYAIKSNNVHGFLTRRFHHEGQWDMAFKFHGADFAVGLQNSRGAEGIYQSLHANGFDKLAMAVLQSSAYEGIGTPADSSQLGYELAWRTQMWDLPEPRGGGQGGSSLYTALRAIHRHRDHHTVDAFLRTASRDEMSRLYSTGNEDMVGIRSRVQTLICLSEIKKWREVPIQDQLASGEILPQAWEDFVNISSDFDFTTLESVIATRLSLLLSVKQREQREQIGDLESPFVSGLECLERKCLLKLSEAARLSERHQTALNASIHAQRLERVPSFEVAQEFASVLWVLKEHKPAVEYLKGLAVGAARSSITNEQEASKNALVLSRLGTWSAEACLQKPTDIREQFFAPATTLLLGSESQELDGSMDPRLAVVFHQYALFAEEQYHAILRSPEVSRLKVYVERKKQEIEQLKQSLSGIPASQVENHPFTHAKRKAEALYDEDVAQFSVHTESRTTFLIQAIEMYSRCLQASNEFDDSAVIRLCSLWFANFGETNIQWNFNHALSRIPSHKFIFLARQLSARLSKPDKDALTVSDAQKHLQSLIVRMCNEHPFHSLYQVWALREDGGNEPDDGRRRSGRGTSVSLHRGRSKAAYDILAICRQHSSNTERVQAIELLCKAYLQWAKHSLNKDDYKQGIRYNMPKVCLREITNLPVPVTTAHTPLDHTLRYENIVTVVKYSPKYTLAGGQNNPKINECIGSDGRIYKQLFKGQGGDDLRQDAVMEQVFELVNIILKRDRQTRKRQLSVRCYQVIPLAPQAGLLEFVDNTMPIGNWLISAHKRYHPDDMTHHQCRDALENNRTLCSQGVHLQIERMRELFMEMRQKFRPVFRHFFTERNKLPMTWFSTRLNYARSAATNSIVGHILGLGDRHVSNILIDNTTGELVHIDLGIAFDQGKLLKVPELVPFRLSADIVDGLGTAGTEGVFRRCAEQTLRVLRAESGIITTVLEVFRHDPLHSWTASAIKIKRMQGPGEASNLTTGTTGFGIGIDMASDAADESADRALTSVRRKLDQSLSVEYTVNELITTAADPTNLCQIFFGWSPHL